MGGLDRTSLASLVETALGRRWATSDRVALLHSFHARDIERLGDIDAAYEAAAVAEPIRTGSSRGGRAFLTTHLRLATPGAEALSAAVAKKRCVGHLSVAQGWIWRRCGLSEEGAVAASAYVLAAAMTNAAVRLGAVGALDAQAVLADCLPLIADLAQAAFDPADPVLFTSAAPWLDVAMMRQARARMRLFSN